MADETIGPAPQQKPSGGKSKTTTIVIVIIVVLLILSIGGWLVSKYIMGKVAEKATEGILGGITGSDVDLDAEGNAAKISSDDGSFEISAGGKWPSDIPSDVPQFTAGAIEASSKSTAGEGGSWSISFTKVQADAYDSYRQALLSAGWNETGTVTTDSKISNMENDKYYLIFTVNESDNTGSLIVTSK